MQKTGSRYLRHLVILWSLTWCLFVQSVAAEELFRSVYTGRYANMNLTLIRTLTSQDQQQFLLSSQAENLLGSILENSEFAINQRFPEPQKYLYQRKILGKKSTESLTFNWPKKKAFYDRDDKAEQRAEHKIVPGILDPTLYQLALQADAANKKNKFQYQFIKRKRVESYRFELVGKDTFKLEKKIYQALVLERKDPQNHKNTKIWLLPELDYQMGKIQHSDDGKTHEMVLTKYRGDTAKVSQFYQRLNANK
jgi:hypothetical protein